jgi:hypothetical protein
MKRRLQRLVLFAVLGLVGLCLGAVLLALIANQGLPQRSTVVERLSERERARLSEATHLRRTLGDAVWPGWGAVDIPFAIYNEEYAFLVGLPDPAPGWTMALGRQRGAVWELVAGDTLDGRPYFRQRLANANETPENFIVQVGSTWAASMQTYEYAEIAFYRGFGRDLPPVVRDLIPYRMVWSTIGGEMDGSLAGLEHEAFHVFQAQRAPDRLLSAERSNAAGKSYPFDDERRNAAWKSELDLLVRAVRAPSEGEARDLARQWLAARRARRADLTPAWLDYERQREWLEGLAKYAELTIAKAAAAPDYQPFPAILSDPSFHRYADRPRFWEMQLDEVRRMDTYRSETRFYYSGFAQAALLDRLSPAWKARALEPGVFLEDLVAEGSK